MDSTEVPLRQGAMPNEERINGQDEDERYVFFPRKSQPSGSPHEHVLNVDRVYENP
jgi:hypothetical protein